MKTTILKIMLLLALTASSEALATPTWFSDGQKRIGSEFYVTCVGSGISLELARNESMRSCKGTAIQQVVDTAKVKTLSVESDESAAYHSEISQTNNIKGLICLPDKESIEETESGYKIYLKCRFDISKVTVSDAPEEEIINRPNSGSIIKNKAEIETIKSDAATTKGNYKKSSESRLTISSVPACTSIVIRGRKSRSVACNTNPLTVILFDGDTEAILRSNGFKPKTIKLNNTGGAADEAITVIFD